MTEKAYAKINLFLDVTGKRTDGFHNIRSIMQSVSLADILEVSLAEAEAPSVLLSVDIGGELSALGITPALLGEPEKNLVFRAAMLYLERAGISARVSVRLTKHIPIAAGLAGGSADAAAILRVLNKEYGKFTAKELSELGAELGSDIPFCIEGGTALCTGRGEHTVRLSYTPDLNIVIAIGKAKISTPKAYAALDKVFSDFDGSVKSHGEELLSGGEENASGELRARLLSEDGTEGCIYNIFECSELPELSEVEGIKDKLRSLGAEATLMSGSGPSVFGIFGTKSKAEEAAGKLREGGIFAVCARTVRY